jgi:substrate import-associated zinc metallohydrolase lipoprotein
LNNFDPKDVSGLQFYFHIMHHEFGHILHQTKEFSRTFQDITKGTYSSSWYTLPSDAYANNLGYVTRYAMSEYHEDFVETIAMMLTRSRAEWEDFLESMPGDPNLKPGDPDYVDYTTTGQYKVEKKRDAVVSYFKDQWQVDIYELQQIIYDAIQAYMVEVAQQTTSPAPVLHAPYKLYDINQSCMYASGK